MECEDVRSRILSDAALGACAEHLEACPPCRELAGGLGRRLGPAEGGPAPDFAALEAALREDAGLLASLRALPTHARRGLVLGAALAIGGGTWLLSQSPGDARALTTVGALGALCALALWHGLRPLHQPPLPRWAWALLLVGGLGLPALVACQPPLAVTGGDTPAWVCLAFGALYGLPVLALAVLVDRAPVAAALGAGGVLVAVAAGSVSNMCLEGHCGTPGVPHRLFGHASLGVCFLAALYALGRARARA